MAYTNDWIKKQIEDVRKGIPAITGEASKCVENLLSGSLSERQLTTKELVEAANKLLAAMTPLVDPQAKGNNADKEP